MSAALRSHRPLFIEALVFASAAPPIHKPRFHHINCALNAVPESSVYVVNAGRDNWLKQLGTIANDKTEDCDDVCYIVRGAIIIML